MTPLQTELAKPEYTGKTDAEAAVMLNAPIITGQKLAPTWQIQDILIHGGQWSILAAAALTPADPRFPVAVIAYDYLRSRDGLNLNASTDDGAKAQQLLAGLQQAGIIDAATAAAINSLALPLTTTRAKQARIYTVVSEAAVHAARGAK